MPFQPFFSKLSSRLSSASTAERRAAREELLAKLDVLADDDFADFASTWEDAFEEQRALSINGPKSDRRGPAMTAASLANLAPFFCRAMRNPGADEVLTKQVASRSFQDTCPAGLGALRAKLRSFLDDQRLYPPGPRSDFWTAASRRFLTSRVLALASDGDRLAIVNSLARATTALRELVMRTVWEPRVYEGNRMRFLQVREIQYEEAWLEGAEWLISSIALGHRVPLVAAAAASDRAPRIPKTDEDPVMSDDSGDPIGADWLERAEHEGSVDPTAAVWWDPVKNGLSTALKKYAMGQDGGAFRAGGFVSSPISMILRRSNLARLVTVELGRFQCTGTSQIPCHHSHYCFTGMKFECGCGACIAASMHLRFAKGRWLFSSWRIENGAIPVLLPPAPAPEPSNAEPEILSSEVEDRLWTFLDDERALHRGALREAKAVDDACAAFERLVILSLLADWPELADRDVRHPEQPLITLGRPAHWSRVLLQNLSQLEDVRGMVKETNRVVGECARTLEHRFRELTIANFRVLVSRMRSRRGWQ